MAPNPRHGGRRDGAGRPKGPVPEGERLFRTSQASLARRYVDEAIETLATILRDKNAPAGVQVSAAAELLSRLHGRPPPMSIEPPRPPYRGPKTEDEYIEELRRRGLLKTFAIAKPRN